MLILVSTIAAIYLYLDSKLSLFSGENWLTVSHVLVPAAFFIVALTNRRYGAPYAFTQVLLSSSIVLASVVLAPDDFRGLLPSHAEPGLRVAGAFGVAFFLASFISIIMFDGARGPRWWTAPLLSFVSAVVVFTTVFFPAAYGGTHAPWLHEMLVYLGLATGASLTLLAPYWVVRGLVQPQSGFGGY